MLGTHDVCNGLSEEGGMGVTGDGLMWRCLFSLFSRFAKGVFD